MKNLFRVLCGISVMSMIPAVAGAVGTYYNGNLYQNPQQRYSRGGYYNSYGSGSGRNYSQQRAYGNQYNIESQLGTQKQQGQNKKPVQQTSAKQGFVLDAGISHEMGSWGFDMNKAGSKLHYDNLAWNVLDAKGTYYLGDNTKMQVTAGFRYGMQYGDSPMVDDDISGSGVWVVDADTGIVYGTPAMSIGTSKDGNQFGFNVAFGLTDFFTWGKMKVTPSIGYRYFKHKLTTKNNYGLSVDVMHSSIYYPNCVEVQAGEIQCSPYVAFLGSDGGVIDFGSFAHDGNGALYEDSNGDYYILVPSGTDRVNFGDTYYYEQSGTSHKYETEWAGPYLALDMEYQVNKDNLFTGGIEFGLPIYDSKGDQPYRWDWRHPTSVEDKGDFGDAYHLGLKANWMTAITDSTYLSLGFTYDYYKVSDATAKTYLNGSGYYQAVLDAINDSIEYLDGLESLTEEQVLQYKLLTSQQQELSSYKAAGWVAEDKKETNSIYKSMGIRIGINMKF